MTMQEPESIHARANDTLHATSKVSTQIWAGEGRGFLMRHRWNGDSSEVVQKSLACGIDCGIFNRDGFRALR